MSEIYGDPHYLVSEIWGSTLFGRWYNLQELKREIIRDTHYKYIITGSNVNCIQTDTSNIHSRKFGTSNQGYTISIY